MEPIPAGTARDPSMRAAGHLFLLVRESWTRTKKFNSVAAPRHRHDCASPNAPGRSGSPAISDAPPPDLKRR